MTNVMKKLTFPLIGAAVLTAVAITGGVIGANQNAVLAADQTSLEKIEAKTASIRASADDAAENAALALTGAQSERVDADTEVIEDLAERAMSWDDHASYVEARESTMRAYSLTEDSSFMTSFLPPAPVTLDPQGNEYPYIDAAGLNSHVSGVTVRLLEVDAVAYSYMVLVDVTSSSSDGLGTASNVATMFVTIDGGDLVTSLEGYASTSPPATSK